MMPVENPAHLKVLDTGGTRTPESVRTDSDFYDSSSKYEPMFFDPRLPPGWQRILKQRKCGATEGRYDVQVASPDGRKFSNRGQLAKFIEAQGLSLDPNDFDFSVFGRNHIRRKPVRRPKTDIPTETNEPPLTVSETLQKTAEKLNGSTGPVERQPDSSSESEKPSPSSSAPRKKISPHSRALAALATSKPLFLDIDWKTKSQSETSSMHKMLDEYLEERDALLGPSEPAKTVSDRRGGLGHVSAHRLLGVTLQTLSSNTPSSSMQGTMSIGVSTSKFLPSSLVHNRPPKSASIPMKSQDRVDHSYIRSTTAAHNANGQKKRKAANSGSARPRVQQSSKQRKLEALTNRLQVLHEKSSPNRAKASNQGKTVAPVPPVNKSPVSVAPKVMTLLDDSSNSSSSYVCDEESRSDHGFLLSSESEGEDTPAPKVIRQPAKDVRLPMQSAAPKRVMGGIPMFPGRPLDLPTAKNAESS